MRARRPSRLAAAACSLAACVAVLVPHAASAADDAGALLAKHKAYAGWQAGDGAIASLREAGTITLDGRVVGTIRAVHRGPVFREFWSRGAGRSFEDGFTGRVLWSSNQNGFTVQTIGEAAKYVYTERALFGEGLTSLPATVVRSETIDGTPLTWVRVAPAVGVVAELAIDPASGGLKRAVLDPSGKYETRYDVLGYTDVGGGKRVISSWRYTGGKSVYAYTTVEANKPVTDDELHPPKQTATWTFDPGAGTVPVELTKYRIQVAALVNGVKGTFILDTGASGIAFTDSFARRAGAKRVGQSEISGIGGGTTANLYDVDTIAFGRSVLHDVIIFTGLDERGSSGNDIAGLSGSICWPARSWSWTSTPNRCASWTRPKSSRTRAAVSSCTSTSPTERPTSR